MTQAPPEGIGTVFVDVLGDGTFVGIWQGDGEHAAQYVDVEGSQDEVLRWATPPAWRRPSIPS